MKDRLKDLYTQGNVSTSTELELEPADDAYGEGATGWPDLFSQVDEVQDRVNRLEVLINSMRQLHDEIIHTPLLDHSKGKSPAERLESMMDEVKSEARSVQARLKNMEKKLEEEQRGASRHSTELRIRKAQHSHLSRKFMSVMEDYNRVQTEYRDQCKDRIVRQLNITGKEMTASEVEEKLDEGDLQVFTQDIILDNERVKQAIGDIEARHNDIITLEKSMKELLELFQELATMVYEQGELINNIENNVTAAAEYVREGKGQIKKAVQLQSKIRHKKIACIVFCLILLAAIALIIGLAVGL
ncbi:syntaxin-1B-like [Corticium candelabrum]|uniref:syntaxin-1B-like n=1 Tax=Corticium candelabrum TaxID=121492 RepID=UPI002E259679|nr:syntaxin-1B-like [Corticium candelabrum]XP_062510494.1 syntaxin-1B-like [Corticium candelabrum]